MLGFDGDEQTREVAGFYGFDCKFDSDVKEEFILLSRSEFIQRKERLILMHSWIEDKRSFLPLSLVHFKISLSFSVEHIQFTAHCFLSVFHLSIYLLAFYI